MGYDVEMDLAVLKVEGQDLPAAEFGISDDLRVGDPAYAIGNPLGIELRNTMTSGSISAINRDVDVDGVTMTPLLEAGGVAAEVGGEALHPQAQSAVGQGNGDAVDGRAPPAGGGRGAGLQPYSLRELRAPAPPGPSFGLRPNDRPGGHRPPSYFLCKQKVTKKLPKPRVLDSYWLGT